MTDTRQSPQDLLKTAVYVILAYAAVMGAVGGYYAYQAYGADSLERGKHYPLMLWGAANCVVALAAAFWAWSYKPIDAGRGEPTAPTKLLFLAVGGLLGFTTVIFLGLGYAILWWDELTKARSAWMERKPWIPVGLVLGGLAVMLVSVLSVRSEERTNVTLRRLIYGYNAVLVGLLVFAILGVGNVMASIYAFQPFDWTETNMYSISDTSKQVLRSLDVPVRVHVIRSRNVSPLLLEDLRGLLDTCRAYAPQFEVEMVTLNEQYRKLVQDYQILDSTDVLVVYDPGGQVGKPAHQSISANELEEQEPMMRGGGDRPRRIFKGERAIISAIRSLREGKVTRTLYFTQDSGEMKLSDSGGQRDRPGAVDRGLAALRGKLERSGFTVKELNLGQVDAATGQPANVPDDAFAVVMAGPTNLGDGAIAASKIKILQDYMKRKDGKLVLFLEAHRNRDGVVQPTGLEGFLAGFGVQVGKDIILHEPFGNLPDPTLAITVPSSQIERAFQESLGNLGVVPLMDVRTVQPAAGGSFTATRMLETAPLSRDATLQWPEENLVGTPEEFVTNLKEKQPDAYNTKRRSPPASIAVTVRDKSGESSMPDDPIHAPMRQGEGQPRMVVFGSTTMASNLMINRGQEVYFNLCLGACNWLKGREGEPIAEIEPKVKNSYRLNVKPEDRGRLLWTPGLLLLVVVVGCGIGVWFLRRG